MDSWARKALVEENAQMAFQRFNLIPLTRRSTCSPCVNCPHLMCIVVKTQEGPAIVICLREGAIHSALALPNAPCRQGVDVTESGKLFSDWLYVELCSAVSLCRDNGLNCRAVNNVPTYYREIVTKLSCDLYLSM